MKSLSKAAQKDLENRIRFINNNLSRRLAQFKNRVLESNGRWAVAELELKLERVRSGEIKANGWSQEQLISSIENKLLISTTISFEAMKEAEIIHDGKILKMAEKMASFGMNHIGFSVEIVRGSGSELEFLVSNREMEVHARAIWVEGDIKAPHFRFITTKRNK